jgi:hypothetical protein
VGAYLGEMPLALAATARAITELFADPVLTIACVFLIVVSTGWIVVTRLIVRDLRKAALKGRRVPRIDVVAPPRDIWAYPPRDRSSSARDLQPRSP